MVFNVEENCYKYSPQPDFNVEHLRTSEDNDEDGVIVVSTLGETQSPSDQSDRHVNGLIGF